MKRRLIALAADRKAALDAAQAALETNNQTDYAAQMEKVANINTQIEQVRNLLAEQERQIMTAQPSAAEVTDMMSERGNELMNRRPVSLSSAEVFRALRNAVTITGTLVQPTGTGTEIHDNQPAISSLLDMVRVEDMTGLSGWEEPYVVSEFDGTVEDPVAKSGQTRTDSADPVFAISPIVPVEISTTSYIDRNISKLSPARYYEKVQQMALRALRRTAVGLIINGAVKGGKTCYGIKTAKNTSGADIIATGNYTAIDVDTLDNLYFAYGADTELGGGAVLQLTKEDLKALGQLRGTNEKRRLFTITPQGNGNRGVIADGGVQIPYVLLPKDAATGLAAGDLLAALGSENIADSGSLSTGELSMEAIIQADPDFIFVTTMGTNEAKALAAFDAKLASNPAWSGLTAIKKGRCIVLPRELFHFKPLGSGWLACYQILTGILY